MLVFCHMMKCAGTTLSHIFRNNYGFDYVEVYPIYRRKDNYGLGLSNIDDIKFFLNKNNKIKCIRGHSLRTYSDIDRFLSNVQYITFLRNPISRYISHYFYGKNHEFDSRNIINWIYEGKHGPIRNYQTKFIAGEENLEKAKDVLKNKYSFIGLVEEFDTSLLLMKKLLNLNNLDIRYKKKNVGFYKKKDFQNNELLKKIVDENRLDISLYNFVVKKIFERQVQQYNGNIKKDLKEFQIDNNNYKININNNFQFLFGKYLIYNNYQTIRNHLRILIKHNIIPSIKKPNDS